MNPTVQQLASAVEAWDGRDLPHVKVLLVSGSGLSVDLPGSTGLRFDLAEALPFETHSVIGHPHEIEILELQSGRFVLYQRGRLHSYQGYDADQTVFMVRLAWMLGARTLLMTNAAGGLRPDMAPGDLVAIRDQINLTGLNPLRGHLPADWGPQFPDMVEGHDPDLRSWALAEAKNIGIKLSEGIYAGLAGPSYETAAEIDMLRRAGADLAGMSTVLEVIAARHLGMRSLCFSLVSNLAAGVTGEPLHHDEVLEAGRLAAADVGRLLKRILESPHTYGD